MGVVAANVPFFAFDFLSTCVSIDHHPLPNKYDK